MINELLNFSRSIESWGIEIPRNWHKKMQSVPKNAKAFLTHINKDGIVEIEDIKLDGLHYYYLNNRSQMLCKITPENGEKKCINSIKSCIKCFNELKLLIGNIDSFAEVSDILNSLNADEIWNVFKEKELDKPFYIAFEIEDALINGLWTQKCIKSINDALWLLQDETKSVGLDFFGNDESGYEEKSCKVKAAISFQYYSRNEDTNCYKKWGRNSTDACKIGALTRSKIDDLLQFVVSKEHEAHFNKETKKDVFGLWYKYKCKNSFKYVLTSLMPYNLMMEAGGFNEDGTLAEVNKLTKKEWEDQSNQYCATLLAKENANPNHYGQVLVINHPNNGADFIDYSRNIKGHELVQYMTDWKNGANNGSSCLNWKYPNIRNLFNCLNKSWKLEGNDFKKENSKKEIFSIEDIYEFFFNTKSAIKKVNNYVAMEIAPMMINSYKLKVYPFELNYYVSLLNLLLYKQSILKENFMDHWSFCMGQIFHKADIIYKNFFEDRGVAPPKDWIGARFLQSAYKNPENAISSFNKSFHKYLQFAQTRDSWIRGYAAGYGRLFEKMMNLMKGIIPSRITNTEINLLTAGYLHREEKIPALIENRNSDGVEGLSEIVIQSK